MYITRVTKRARDPEGRRNKILQAAGELIREIGVAAVTHRKVAERAQVPLGSTTHYFRSLTDMLAEALAGLKSEREELMNEFGSALEQAEDPVGVLVDMVMEALADPVRIRNELSFALLQSTHPKMRRFIIPTDADLLKQISRGIPEKTVQAVLAYFYGVMFLAAVQGQGAVTPREEVEEALRRLIGDTTAEHT